MASGIHRSAPRFAVLAVGGLAAIGIAMAGVSQAAAKEYKGNSALIGVVIGPDDKPVPHAVISYQSSSGAFGAHVTHTDSTGHFAIGKLPADSYDLRASAKGLFSDWEKNVSLRKGETKSVTLRLIYSREPLKPQPNKSKPANQSGPKQ